VSAGIPIPQGLRLMAGGAFAFSVMTACAKLAGVRLPLFEIVAARSLVVSVIAGVALWRGGHSFRGVEISLLLQRALLGFGALTCYFYSIIHLPLADATVIYFTNPVLTALAAAWVLHERMGVWELVLVVLSLVGVLFVARPSFLFGAESSLDPLGVGLGVISAFFGASAYITLRRMQRDPPLLVVFYFSTITVLIASPMMMLNFVVPNAMELFLLTCMGVATHVGQLAVTWAFRMERAGRAAAVGYLQIVFAAGWGWLLFSEVPDIWTWLGAAIIAGATVRLVRLHPAR
jgi:drug/metabolite transporter (DMT)-like permease